MNNNSIKCRLDNCDKIRENGQTLCTLHRSRWRKYKSFDLPEKPKLSGNIVKICKTHGHLTINQVYKDGIKFYRCKICKVNTNRAYLERNPDLIAYKRKIYEANRPKYDSKESVNGFKQRLRRMFHLSIEDYELMLKQQNNVCKICKQPEMAFNRIKLTVDHCHKTGKIRGLLCGRCNTMIGMAKDSLSILKAAIEYLS